MTEVQDQVGKPPPLLGSVTSTAGPGAAVAVSIRGRTSSLSSTTSSASIYDLPMDVKRRPSISYEDGDPILDDCAAAMVLMSLSCSPKSPLLFADGVRFAASTHGFGAASSFDSGLASSVEHSSRTSTPSPPSFASSASVGGSDNGGAQQPVPIINGTTIKPAIIKANNQNRYRKSPSTHSEEELELDESTLYIDETSNHTVTKSRVKTIGAAKHNKRKKTHILYQCTWRGCGRQYDLCEDIEQHIRRIHLGLSEDAAQDHEEEFYYTEIEMDSPESHHGSWQPQTAIIEPSTHWFNGNSNSSLAAQLSPSSNSCHSPLSNGSPGPFTASAPTWSHLDMARPPTEDPEYKRSLIQATASHPINIPGQPQIFGRQSPSSSSLQSSLGSNGRTMMMPLNLSSPKSKQMRLNGHHHQHKTGGAGRSLLLPPNTKPTGGPRVGRQRGEARKCRKVYGMDARDAWCTQCKWKKACTRFSD